MSKVEGRSSEAQGRDSLPSKYQLLVQNEVRKIASRYLGGVTTLLGLFAALGLVGIYGVISQSLTSTLTTKLGTLDAKIDTKLATLDARIDQATSEERARISKSHDQVLDTARDAFKAAVKFQLYSEQASRQYLDDSKAKFDKVSKEAAETINALKDGKIVELEAKIKGLVKKIDGAETLRMALLKRIQDSDSQLVESNRKLEEFNIAVNQTVAKGADRIVTNPAFQKAVADRINTKSSEALTRLDELADGKSPLNGVWVFNGSVGKTSYSLEIAKNRFLLVGIDHLMTFATFDPVKRTITTDAIGAFGWPDGHIGDVSADWKSIVWQGADARWTRP